VRNAIRPIAWVLLFVAPAAAVVSWFTPRPALDAADAGETALGALAEVGVRGSVDEPVRLGKHRPEEGGSIEAWVVMVEVPGKGDAADEQIELRVQETAGRLVYVDDRIGPDDTARLLSDEEFDRLGEYRNDATSDRWYLRNAGAVLAAALVAGVAFFLVARSDRLWKDD
jgi:hypothetical protein